MFQGKRQNLFCFSPAEKETVMLTDYDCEYSNTQQSLLFQHRLAHSSTDDEIRLSIPWPGMSVNFIINPSGMRPVIERKDDYEINFFHRKFLISL